MIVLAALTLAVVAVFLRSNRQFAHNFDAGESDHSGSLPLKSQIPMLDIFDSIAASKPASGTEFGTGAGRGHSTVLFRNNGDHNVLGKIWSVDGRSHDRLIFIEPFKSATMKRVRSGRYLIHFCTGTNWDWASAQFSDAACQEFEDGADLRTSEDEKGMYWHNFQLTIEPVIGGTAKTKVILPSQF
jgi:hypothetical protein